MSFLLLTNSSSIWATMAQPPPKVKQPILKKVRKIMAAVFKLFFFIVCHSDYGSASVSGRRERQRSYDVPAEVNEYMGGLAVLHPGPHRDAEAVRLRVRIEREHVQVFHF